MYPSPIQSLITLLTRLPGVGPKTAERYAFFLLRQPQENVVQLADALRDLHTRTQRCRICLQYNDAEVCAICKNPQRDPKQICVVAESQDVEIMESAHEFHGRYHVLGGTLSPTEGITPEQLSLAALKKRVADDKVTELIIATNPTVEGEATALYIKNIFAGQPVALTRIARGLPMGADIEFADPATLANALQGRREF